MAEPGVAGCKSESHFVAGGFYGATNVDKFLQARGCARQRLRISRQRMTTAVSICALEGFSCNSRAGTTTGSIQELLAFELLGQEQVWFHIEKTIISHEQNTVLISATR